ncbi:pyridoxal phosphate-dependent aminotransferase [Streptomyces chumphonensis]|uniref:alanine transaminase n=1 Tax=Streptomyces chumphonensis TaxID=1214925 RepID=A0A927EUU0_9ACTN|nr:aminotransferase class I/II-fold pyridoxal phosphate-dependent enzyme [Streptomyces chumphonensis]MBD3929979.1 aminotransferase class I/II-fold pyridoxal phosphate-dependent enzyme [Streptomyces chumphonensis]
MSRAVLSTSSKLSGVSYSLRGPLAARAESMRAEGRSVVSMNVGDPVAHGLPPRPEVVRAMRDGIDRSAAYGPARGLPDAREAVAGHYRGKGFDTVEAEDVYLGNGVSELAASTLHALLEPQDEVLIPAPDYPMWTASTVLAGGRPVHYPCDETSGWLPDPVALRDRITARTRAIVAINPNNPTGSVWPRPVVDAIAALARRHGLLLLADEIYDDFLYDGALHSPLATCAPDTPCVTFGGLSKRSRVPGFRMGWAVLTGPRAARATLATALDTVTSLRLCPNVPAQRVVPTALRVDDTKDLTGPGGAFRHRRDHLLRALAGIPGIHCVKPGGAFYAFPRIDVRRYRVDGDALAGGLLREEGLLVVPGAGLGPVPPGHLRMVTMPPCDVIDDVAERLARFLERHDSRRTWCGSVP